MSICNLFTGFNKDTGNYISFSQYAKDLTKSNSRDDAYKIVPSKFIAMDIDYSKVNIPIYGESRDLNIDIPMYFQNVYENACAYCESQIDFYPSTAKSLFWNAMDISGMIGDVFTEEDGVKRYEDSYIRYISGINIQSFDEYNDIGYSEIYCHIPPTHKYFQYFPEYISGDPIINDSQYIEGYPFDPNNPDALYFPLDKYENYKEYRPSATINNIDIEDRTEAKLQPISYNINTIVVLYDILAKSNDGKDTTLYSSIPMGIYFAGKFNSDYTLTNTITKYISNDSGLGMGTSYGLRICSRFTVTPNNTDINSIDVTTDGSDNYSAFCQVMTKMSENIDKMNEVISSSFKVQQNLQDMLAIFKNNRINTPYIKEIAGKSYWFVNGKLIGESVLIEHIDIQKPTDSDVNKVVDSLITELDF